MTAIEIFSQINDRQIKALMFHNQMADYFDFLGLNGFKRVHEYQYFAESVAMRGIHRYVINHTNRLLLNNNTVNPNAIPATWNNYCRFDVDAGTRKSAVKEAFQKYYDWEYETLHFYECKFKELSELGCIAYTNKVMELIKDTDKELKHIARSIIKYKAADWDMTLIEEEQDAIHEHYKEKTKNLGIDIT